MSETKNRSTWSERFAKKEKKRKAYHFAYRRSPKGKFIVYRQNAKERNLIFELTFEEFKSFWGFPCYYCGDNIETIGLDRVDSKKGYSMDNVVPCCSTCNWMKLAKTKDEFLSHCRKIIEKSCQTGEDLTPEIKPSL